MDTSPRLTARDPDRWRERAAGAAVEGVRGHAGLDGLAWLFGAAELLAPAPPAGAEAACEDARAEAPPRAA